MGFSFDLKSCTPTADELVLVGGAHYPSDARCLRLTATDGSGAPAQNSFGRAIYGKRVALSGEKGKRAGFLTTVTFKLSGEADGLVFFMCPGGYKYPAFSNDGNLGIFDQLSVDNNAPLVFAVEFDIRTNAWDPTDCGQHLGINIQSRDSSTNYKPIPDSFIGQEVTMKINYEGTTGTILVVATAAGTADKVVVNCTSDLSSFLPSAVEVGLGASTGNSVAFHNVTFWEFTSTTPATAASASASASAHA